jgi:hypothetical protein
MARLRYLFYAFLFTYLVDVLQDPNLFPSAHVQILLDHVQTYGLYGFNEFQV